MTKIAIVYHSSYGHTMADAKAVEEGAKSVLDTEVLLLTTDEAKDRIEDLNKSDAIIFGAPTYMGDVSAQMKTFMDSTGGIYMEGKWHGKIAAGFTSSSNLSGDKLHSLITMAIFAAQHGMLWVNLPLVPKQVEGMNRLGGWIGAMSQSSNEPNQPPIELTDLATAKFLGKYVAEVTNQFLAGKNVKK